MGFLANKNPCCLFYYCTPKWGELKPGSSVVFVSSADVRENIVAYLKNVFKREKTKKT